MTCITADAIRNDAQVMVGRYLRYTNPDIEIPRRLVCSIATGANGIPVAVVATFSRRHGYHGHHVELVEIIARQVERKAWKVTKS